MNKLFKRTVITYSCVCFFLYLGGSFVALSFNPANWEEGVRLVLWVISVMLTVFWVHIHEGE